MRLPYNDETKNVCDVVCYIDESGTIRTPLYIQYSDSVIETTTEGFDFSQTVEAIKRQMLEDTREKADVINKLIKTIGVAKQN